MRQVTFIKDFGTRKKGEIFLCDSMLASQLVREDKVAEYSDNVKKEPVKKQTTKKDNE